MLFMSDIADDLYKSVVEANVLKQIDVKDKSQIQKFNLEFLQIQLKDQHVQEKLFKYLKESIQLTCQEVKLPDNRTAVHKIEDLLNCQQWLECIHCEEPMEAN